MFKATNSDGHAYEFDGELLAHVSSEEAEKPRWTEFSLWLTPFNTWILEGVGRSRIPGETDRYWCVVSSDPIDFIDKIVGADVSKLAKRLLKESFLFLRECD